MTYRILDENSATDYARSHAQIMSRFTDSAGLFAQEVGDGNLNLVFVINSSQKPDEAIILKQAVPYLRVAGDSWPLSRERMRFESQALMLYNELTPGLAPQVYAYDEEMSLVAMEYLGSYEVMRRPLVVRKRFDNFADHASTFLATILFKTSDLFRTGLDKKRLQASFINPHLCKIQEDFVFTNPYMDSPENRWNPVIDAQVRAVRSNARLKLAIAELKEKYMTQGQALIHSDLHTGSIMVTAHDTRIIDPEFSFFGPMGYDIGALISNLMINFASHYAHTADQVERDSFQHYLLDTIRGIWTQFAAKFNQLWIENNTGELVPAPYWGFAEGAEAFAAYRQSYVRQLLQDTAGLGACESLRRMMGIVSVWDISSIADGQERARAEDYIIRVSTRWILEREAFTSIEGLIGVMEEEAYES